MPLILVPLDVTTTTASVWVGVFGTSARPPATWLTNGTTRWPVPAAAWRVVDADGILPADRRTCWIQIVPITGLSPNRELRLSCPLSPNTSCRIRTLPASIPRAPDLPFTILLASCFTYYQDEAGLAGLNLANLPHPFKPTIKMMVGDQVYLDNPAAEILPRNQRELAARLLDKYVRTWTQGESRIGFSRILSEGSTYFLADDHEFWNNHPNWNPIVGFRTRQQLDEWEQVARSLYRSFQGGSGRNPQTVQMLSVDPIDICLVDTRWARLRGDDQFIDPGELTKLKGWLTRDPHRPGILVIGAPLFTEAASWWNSWLQDRSLANYRAQYNALVTAVLQTKRSLLVLCGDIHCGRIAQAVRLNDRATLFELVSSPLALVSRLVGRKFYEAPGKFPHRAISGMASLEVNTLQWDGWTDDVSGLVEDQFMTLGFTQTDQTVHVKATVWQLDKVTPHSPIQKGTYDCVLQRR